MIFSFENALAQDSKKKEFILIEKEAQFPGGENALLSFIAENVSYPRLASETGVEGVVYVDFVINTDGSLSNEKIKRDIGGGCGAEVLRVLRLMPKWIPAEQGGKKVRVHFTLPVNFELENDKASRKARRKARRAKRRSKK